MALTDKLKAIADAIRAKTGKTDQMTLDEMPTEIASITTGGGTTSGSTSTKPYKITIKNNNSSLKIVKGFSGSDGNLTPLYCLAGESYDIYVDLGDVVSILFYDSRPNYEENASPLVRVHPNTNISVSSIEQAAIIGDATNVIPRWKRGALLAVATYIFYYGANNTHLTFN